MAQDCNDLARGVTLFTGRTENWIGVNPYRYLTNSVLDHFSTEVTLVDEVFFGFGSFYGSDKLWTAFDQVGPRFL